MIVRTEPFFDGRYWTAECPEGWTFRKDTSVSGYPYVFETEHCRLQLGTSSRTSINFGGGVTRPGITSEGVRKAYVMTLHEVHHFGGGDVSIGGWIWSMVRPMTASDHKVTRHDGGSLVGFTYQRENGWAGTFSDEPWIIYASFICRASPDSFSPVALGILASIRFHDRPDPPSPRNLIFDLDGTITDPAEGILGCIKHALDAMGVESPGDEALKECIGPPLQDSFPRLLRSTDEATVRRAVKLYRTQYEKRGLYQNRVYAGIVEAFMSLQKSGYRLYVATSKPTVYASKVVEYLGLRSSFEAVAGSELDGTRTNKAELIGYLLEQHRLDASECIVIGDRRYDIEGARANAIPAIGALWGYGSREELETAGAAMVCEKPTDVCRCVAALSRTAQAS